MAEDRTSSPDESQDRGVLDTPGTSTTAIDLGATAQVSVSLPAGYRDDDGDDDVTADELSADEVAETASATDSAAPAEDADDADDVEEPEVDAPAQDVDEPEAEDAGDETSGERLTGEDDAGESDDVVDVDLNDNDNDNDERELDAELADAELADAEQDAADADEDREGSAQLDDSEDADDTDTAADTDDAAGAAGPAISADATDADAEDAPAKDAEQAPQPIPEEIVVTQPDPVPATKDTNRTWGAPQRAERESFLRPPARRLDDVEAAATRESSDVLTDERLLDTGAIRRPEPEDPWRRIVYAATGGLVNLGDGKKTRARKELMAGIAAPLTGRARFVPVLSRKGGVGKTTVSALLGMALADARDDRVVAIDANPDRGTLAERIAKTTEKTVRDLVRGSDDVHGYGDLSAHVVRDSTRLDVLASDADPHVADAFSDADYRKVADLAQYFYSLVLTDTGTGIVHSVMDATLDLADQIVIVSGTSVDEARLASETLTWLETNGRGDLARNAVVVINQETSGTKLVRLDELESHFRSRARDVVRIPYDARIATGSAITFHELNRATRTAARRLAALVIEGIRAA